MKNLKNFDTKEDFLLEQEKPLYNTILHNEDEVYIQPTMATYVCDGETNCIKLTNRKDLFSSFTVNGVEMINPNEPSMLGLLTENPLYYCNNDVEHIEIECVAKIKPIIQFYPNYINSSIKHTMSFNRKLNDGESIVIIVYEDYYYQHKLIDEVFIVGNEKFNTYFVYDETTLKYEFLINEYMNNIYPRVMANYWFNVYGCVNSNGVLVSNNDYISTTVDIFDGWSNDVATYSSVTLECRDTQAIYENCFEFEKLYFNNYYVNFTIDFGRLVTENDIIYNVETMFGLGEYVTQIPYEEFIEFFQLIEGTTKYIFLETNIVNTYRVVRNFQSFVLLNKDTEFNLETTESTLKYSYDLIKPFPEGYELKCTFKFIDDTINGNTVFYDCYYLKSIDLRSYKNLKIGECYDLFCNSSLETIKLCDVEFINNGNNNFYGLFGGCFNLKSVDLTPFLNNIQPYHDTFSSMFSYCSNIEMIKMMGDVSNITDFEYMFDGIPNKGIFYCDNRYDYSKIIEKLPQGWEVYKI